MFYLPDKLDDIKSQNPTLYKVYSAVKEGINIKSRIHKNDILCLVVSFDIYQYVSNMKEFINTYPEFGIIYRMPIFIVKNINIFNICYSAIFTQYNYNHNLSLNIGYKIGDRIILNEDLRLKIEDDDYYLSEEQYIISNTDTSGIMVYANPHLRYCERALNYIVFTISNTFEMSESYDAYIDKFIKRFDENKGEILI